MKRYKLLYEETNEILSQNVLTMLKKAPDFLYSDEQISRFISYAHKHYAILSDEAKKALDTYMSKVEKSYINHIKKNPVLLDAAKYVNVKDAYDKIRMKYRNKEGFIRALDVFSTGGWFSGLTSFIEFVKDHASELKIKFEKDIYDKKSFKADLKDAKKQIIKSKGKFLAARNAEDIVKNLFSSGGFLIKSSVQKKLNSLYKDALDSKENEEVFIDKMIEIIEVLEKSL